MFTNSCGQSRNLNAMLNAHYQYPRLAAVSLTQCRLCTRISGKATTHSTKSQSSQSIAVKRRDLAVTGMMCLLSLPTLAADLQQDLQAQLDTQITHKVTFDVGVCRDSVRLNRGLGEQKFCDEFQPLGTLTIGLFGRLVPITVSNFLKTVEAGAYNGSVFNKVLPGEYISAGKQGYLRNGEVEAPNTLESNPELASAKAFLLSHSRPGTVSLALSENADSAQVTLSKDYHPTQFLVTTGPGPAPRLNNGNVVFGRLIDGFDVLATISEVKTFTPPTRVQAFNSLAKALGDERADEARKNWGRPIQPVVITASKVAEEQPVG